ncbi:carboxypeptidase D-like [Corticium candelabrum]|uniref:carboxypeptidase D-like n=1 Tax=Corticium candelabrum TaxID=121492 RepID=UPI002E26A980|nr:carboxypeptidase D-like [Corticium candelabrum]
MLPWVVIVLLTVQVIFNQASASTVVNKSGRIYEPRTGEFRHHHHVALERIMRKYALKYPHISRLYSIGQSVRRHNLWVMEITDNPGVHEPGEPEIKYVGTIHGNEVVGREMLLLLIKYLLRNYGLVDHVTRLVNTTRIHILPAMNPDGYAIAEAGDVWSTVGRANAKKVDLNRNFPSVFRQPKKKPEPETRAIMEWSNTYPFVLSAGLHGGALVVNYPYDDLPKKHRKGKQKDQYSECPDDDVFRHISLVYSKSHKRMYNFSHCPGEQEHFPNGITNGAAWYTVVGGMQDYNYHYTNCFEVTLELSCTKFPRKRHLQGFWLENKPALLAFMGEVHNGIKGFVMDRNGNPLSKATISVGDRNHDVLTAASGDYWRLLIPGTYKITAAKAGYVTKHQHVRVPQSGAAELNFVLDRKN